MGTITKRLGALVMLNHVLDAIGGTGFCKEPWPHLTVSNIFPQHFYKQLQDNWPELRLMGVLSPGTPNRFLYWLVKDGKEADDLPSFWKEFCGCLPLLREVIEKKFRVNGSYIGAELLHDLPTYYIGPHTDTRDKLVTGLIYMPETSDHSSNGTELYHCATPDPRGKGHKWGRDYKLVKTIPYVPNTALFFQRTDLSYHGVRPTPVERRIIAFDIFK